MALGCCAQTALLTRLSPIPQSSFVALHLCSVASASSSELEVALHPVHRVVVMMNTGDSEEIVSCWSATKKLTKYSSDFRIARYPKGISRSRGSMRQANPLIPAGVRVHAARLVLIWGVRKQTSRGKSCKLVTRKLPRSVATRCQADSVWTSSALASASQASAS